MGRSRAYRRLLAVSVVLASAGSALALVVTPQATSPQSNPSVGQGSASRVLFALRNTSAGNITVTGFTDQGGGPMLPLTGKPGAIAVVDCTKFTSPIALDNTTAPWTLAPGEVKQFSVSPAAALTADGDYSCTLGVTTSPADSTPSVPITFHVASAATLDTQPTTIDFGTKNQTNTENQTVIVSNYTAGAQTVMVELTNNQGGNYSLVGCGGNTTCGLTVPANGGTASVGVHCNGINATNGTLTVHDASVVFGNVVLTCAGSGTGSGITLDPNALSLYALVGMSVGSNVIASGSGSATASFANGGGAGTLSIGSCTSSPCALPFTLAITCTPTNTQQSDTLVVTGAGTTASIPVTCAPLAGPPVLSVTPSMISFPDTPVGGDSVSAIKIENTGGGSLTNVQLSLSGTDAAHFSFDECTAASPCTVVAGAAKTVGVHFKPLAHDLRQAQLYVTTADSGGSGTGSGTTTLSQTVALAGTGIGGVMVVTEPSVAADYHLDFGTLPLGAVGSAQIALRNDGNAVYTANVTGVTAPYALDAASVSVDGNGGTASIMATCSSGSASPSNDQSWTVTGTGAYKGSPQTITVSCAIADTNVIIDPLAFDFGEVRKGSPAPSMPLTVTNPGPGSVEIASMQLRMNKPGLSLVPPTTQTTLAPNAVASSTLSLSTSEDTDLTGELVDITAGSATLSLPVRGKVVTPHSRIAPERLDLGTSCVGTQATGEIRLINDGTATLSADAPEMDATGAFYATTAQTMWPSALAAGTELAATISPSPTAAGPVSGMLTWRDDSPAVYEVPVTLEYVTSGTALSPRGLDFGSVAVDGIATSQRINVENCDPENRYIRVKQLRGIKGPIGAWVVDPQVGYEKTLGPREKLAVLVTFMPPGRGHYEAELLVETDSGDEKILLIGDATGKDFASTSFYSCACSTPGAPWRGWPIALAVILVSVRRRRGSSSAR